MHWDGADGALSWGGVAIIRRLVGLLESATANTHTVARVEEGGEIKAGWGCS